MGSIRNLLNKVQKFSPEQAAKDSIVSTKETIAVLNLEQLNKGLRSDGSFMPDYSPVSVEVFGKKPGPMTLKDTGDFYAGWTVQLQGDKVTISSTDPKTDKLFKKYATKKANIFGLSGPFKREYLNEVLRKAFRAKVKEGIGL